ncbi:hypothetical protein CRG98_016856 [Punica granatum]|uniref:Uncharacterized protein n=1 Tax=Punica granatum TaxID=22663 RepID=A0A2I0K2H1_PUNGR|nr:hypothetical protein CRG98_016856 [Punica granatum]
MEMGLRLRIGGPTPELIGISNSRSRSTRGLGPPIGDSDPTLEVSDVVCGCRQPWWWVGVVNQRPKPFFFPFEF